MGLKRASQLKENSNRNKRKIFYWHLFRYADLRDLLLLAFGALCTIIAGTTQPYLYVTFGKFVGELMTYEVPQNGHNTNPITSGIQDCLNQIILAIVFSFFCHSISDFIFSYTKHYQTFKLRRIFFENMMNRSITWYDVNQNGDFATSFSENLAKIEEGIGEKAGIFLYYQAVFVSSIIWSCLMGLKLTLISLILFPATCLFYIYIFFKSAEITRLTLESYGKANGIAEEVFSSIRTVVAFAGQQKETQKYEENLNVAKNIGLENRTTTGLASGTIWFFLYLTCAISFWFGTKLMTNDPSYSPVVILTIFCNIISAMYNFATTFEFFPIFGAACGAARKIFDVLDEEFPGGTIKDEIQLEEISGEIIFKEVFFYYPSRPKCMVLKCVSLKIRAGETVAFVGGSGSGKSTCIHLLQKFYPLTFGKIYIDNHDVTMLNTKLLRNQIAVVSQEPALFSTTIAENIRFGKLSATQMEIEDVARRAQIHQFIVSLPEGYQTVLGENGSQISGGQKQRIAIARAMIRNPSILLLDEATSALDSVSESEVQNTFDEMCGKTTTIIIAHRLSTIKRASRIFVFSDGKVIEEGNYDQLLTVKGRFYNLVKAQHYGIIKERSMRKNAAPIYRKESIHLNGAEKDETTNEQGINFLGKLFKMAKPEWFWLITGCVSSLGIGAGLPIYSLLFTDMTISFSLDEQPSLEYVKYISVAFIVLGIFTGFSYTLQAYAFGKAGENLSFRIRSKMFSSMLNQEIAWFDKSENSVGALCERLSANGNAIQEALGRSSGIVLGAVANILISYTMCLFIHFEYTLILTVFIPITLTVIYFQRRINTTRENLKYQLFRKSATFAGEAIGNVRTVKAFGLEKHFIEQYSSGLETYLTTIKKNSYLKSTFYGVGRSLEFFGLLVGIYFANKIMSRGSIHYSTVLKVLKIMMNTFWIIGTVFAFVPTLLSGLHAAEDAFKLIERKPSTLDSPESRTYLWKRGNLGFVNVHFSYPTSKRTKILNGLNLKIPDGKTVALLGLSGSGKSTIIQLLQRFYDPSSGKIVVDHFDIKSIRVEHYRNYFGIVSQEPNLFNRSIADNIAYGDNGRNVKMEEVLEAARQANIHNFISALPQGYETVLGTKGVQVSGGQKQRIAIARVFVRNPLVLLLDEATSALDAENEKVVQEALDEAAINRTCVVVSHKLEAVRKADLIYVIDKGSIIEMGNHEELLKQRGLYYHMSNV